MPRLEKSPSYDPLRELAVGDQVPADLYVLDYRDGQRPRWTVLEIEEFPVTAGRALVLVDPANGADDLFDDGRRVAVKVITHPQKTLRTQPYLLGTDPPGMLCDMDQQARHVAKQTA